MLDRVVRMGLGLVVGVWVARYLGPAKFGTLSFAMSFVALFGTLTTVGLEGIVIRHIVLDVSVMDEVIGTAFAIRFIGSVTAVCLIASTIHFIQPDRSVILVVDVMSIGLIFGAFDTIDSYFQSQVQSKLTVWAKNCAFLVAAALRVLLIYMSGPLWAFASAQVVELSLGALALIVVYRWRGGRLSSWRFTKTRALQLLGQSWPVLLSGMAIMIYMRIDMVMLKLMQGDVAVGIYATATRVSEVWYFVPMAIVSSISPAIIRSLDDPRVYYARIEKLFAAMSLLSLVLGSGVALASGWIIRTLYTTAFAAAAPVLAVHVWASVFVFLGVAQAPWDLSQNLLKLGFYRNLAGGVSNILLNLVLIPRYSALGAAFATVISYAISSVVANAFSARTRKIFYMQLQSILLYKLWATDKSAA